MHPSSVSNRLAFVGNSQPEEGYDSHIPVATLKVHVSLRISQVGTSDLGGGNLQTSGCTGIEI